MLNDTPHSITQRALAATSRQIGQREPKKPRVSLEERLSAYVVRLEGGDKLLRARGTRSSVWTWDKTQTSASAKLCERLLKDGRLECEDGGGLFEGNPGQVYGLGLEKMRADARKTA